jgi:hypothetical protein
LSELGFVGQPLHQALRHIVFQIALDPLEGLIESEHQDLLSKMGRVVQSSSWPEVLAFDQPNRTPGTAIKCGLS